MGWPQALSLRARRRGWTVAIPPGGDASPLYRRGGAWAAFASALRRLLRENAPQECLAQGATKELSLMQKDGRLLIMAREFG